jgi:hypothetical protein
MDGSVDDTAKQRREGGCMCGAVRYHAVGQPLRSGICHCLDCRKYSGSAFTTFAVWPRGAFEVAGQIATFSGRSFCPICGSRLFSLTSDEAEIMVGSFDDAPSDLIPGYELWVKRREDWLQKLPWADQFEEDRIEGAQNWRHPVQVHGGR